MIKNRKYMEKRRIMDEKSHHQGKIYIPVKNRPKSNRRIKMRNLWEQIFD